MGEYRHIIHDLPPVYDKCSRVLILGSLPSVSSRGHFFYNHPRNRFWKVLEELTGHGPLCTAEEKKQFLLEYHIAVWDVIRSCDIIGSSDSSIKNAIPNDIGQILSTAPDIQIFVNGKTAERYYKRYIEKNVGRTAQVLPSTSPANAAWSLEALTEAWQIIM